MFGIEFSKTCGLIMPISIAPPYGEAHCEDVKEMIEEAAREIGLTPMLVSDAEETGVIHARIVKNLREMPVVVCDVSSRNPNVMFELGLRLAFDRPTVLIKDELTSYSFDISAIEHLSYKSTMKHRDAKSFVGKLSKKIKSTFEAGNDPSYSPFLNHFHIDKKHQKEVETNDQLSVLKEENGRLRESIDANNKKQAENKPVNIEILARTFALYQDVVKSLKQIKEPIGREKIKFQMQMDSTLMKTFETQKDFESYFGMSAKLFDSLK